ncbi:carboxymuconolactone decarboxylase family protein [Labedella phragmitis]|uniref:Carboxymuconolactone decarboxylase family protein n=1 Tax=Labedella phragmitis TaxID=2498849 RepID=A0A3S4DIV4_9MICO|nr:carboxymuconolactone decarboxylase family protein [Labedella phragmitis]RWZ52542.1 carboxymuconolactone decarboxylase family protein [Labedella phragmitis]
MRPYMDKVMPGAWKAAGTFAIAVGEEALRQGLSPQEMELIKLRASQMNGCVYCLDLHSRKARAAGLSQQKLDILPAWRETDLFDDREQAVLAIAEAATVLPLSEESKADLFGARTVLGDETFAAAEWIAVTINAFNRISILSGHPVHPRGE